MTRSERVVRSVFAGICQYETLAITNSLLGKPVPVLPTLSSLCHRRWSRQAALVAVFIAHVNLVRTVAEAVEEVVEKAAADAAAEVIAEMT